MGFEPSKRGQLALAALLAIGVGVALAPQVYSSVTGPDGTVAVVEIDGTIDESKAQFVEGQLRDARHNDSVEAVVLEVDSPGGLPAQSERMYAAVERTSDDMPVIAAVDTLGASGAYLAMSAADDIYVAPSAQAVGSVGVTGPAPQPLAPAPGDSGPNKGGLSPEESREDRETLANLFLESVMTQRGDEIELSREELSRAKTYLGTEAVENGLADEIGFVDGAVADAADRAGLDDYAVDYRRTEEQQGLLAGLPLGEDGEEMVVASRGDGLDDQLILAVPPQFVDRVTDDDLDLVYYAGEHAPTGDTAPTTDEPAAVTGGDSR
jgi:protease-4